jgi:RimJ/RimL family protein N-acetyltransferase
MQTFLLQTDRLLLQPHQPGDWQAFHRLAEDSRVMRYITGGIPFPPERSRAFVARQQAHLVAHGYCRWKITLPETGEYLGFCGAEHKVLDGETVPEIGWWIAPEYWGKGYASEAAHAAFGHLWNQVRVGRITSCAFPDNAPSIRIMQKIGLSFEKEFLEPSPLSEDSFRLVMYSRTR